MTFDEASAVTSIGTAFRRAHLEHGFIEYEHFIGVSRRAENDPFASATIYGTIVYPPTITSIGTQCTYAGGAFDVVLPQVTTFDNIFGQSASLRNITFGANITKWSGRFFRIQLRTLTFLGDTFSGGDANVNPFQEGAIPQIYAPVGATGYEYFETWGATVHYTL